MISNLHDIEQIIGNELVKQSELDSSKVLNASSLHGVDLLNFITSTEGISYTHSDSIIIFDIENTSSSNDFTEYDESIRITSSLEVSLTIYGDESINLSRILQSRFESEKCRDNLLSQGVYLADVQSPKSVNEFINNEMYQRTDLSLSISCEMMIKQVDEFDDMNNLNTINVIK